MKYEEFETILDERIAKMRETLASKAKEYAPGADRLANFREGAGLLGCSPARVCLGYLTKHLVSLVALVAETDAGVEVPAVILDEKLGDAINYLVLLESLLVEARENCHVDT